MESKASVKFFGEGQPMGFIGKDAKEKILSSCSGYVSAVGPEGGFGLMEHEAMAAGCPVVGRWWGDFSEDAPDHPGLFGTDEEVLEAAIRISKDRAYAGLVSEAGLAYIRQHRTREKLDDSILDLLVDMGLR